MHFVYNALMLLSVIKWGDWRNWRQYYPTILFFIVGDLLKQFLLYEHSMWSYQELYFGANAILKNHTFITLMIMFVFYTGTILIFLGHYPAGKLKQFFWIMFWVGIYFFIEYINLYNLNLINHHNGWTIWWSLVFNIIMFVTLRIHFKNPLIAWALSFVIILALWNIFDVPVSSLK